jgi:hypothetical protein
LLLAGRLGSIYWCEPGQRDMDQARRIRVIDISDIYAGKQHLVFDLAPSKLDPKCTDRMKRPMCMIWIM